MLFIFLLTFLLVGPRRVIRGARVIREWMRNGFRRASRTETAKKGRSFMRGLGSMVRYFRQDDGKK
jgi:Sec-independent protein translocase protein TatA